MVKGREIFQILSSRQFPVKCPVPREHYSKVLSGFLWCPRDAVSVDERVPCGRRDEGAEDLDGGCLSGAVGP